MLNTSKTKAQRIESVKQRLLQTSLPRIQVSIILLFTAMSGFLTSFSLLHLGVSSMTLRYPLAISIAYCVFLLLLRFWLWLHQSHNSLSLDFDVPSMDFGSADSSNFAFGGGGDFGGAGAGGSWGDSVSSALSSGDSLFDGVSFDLDLQELGLLILAVVALIGGLFASLYIIYIAPVLLAEILLDGVLVSGLYKTLKEVEQTYWLQTAVKRTITPALLVVLLFTVTGFAMQKAVPKAHSIGEVWNLTLGADKF